MELRNGETIFPQESGRKFLGNKQFLGNGGPEKRGTKKGNAQPRMRAMMLAQIMMPAGRGQQRLNYATDNVVDNAANNGYAVQ